MHCPGEAHEVLPREGIAGEELLWEQRPLELITGLTGGDEVPGMMRPAPGERDHMVQGGALQSQAGPTVDASTSTIPKGRPLDLTLELLVLHAASVTG